MDNKSVDFVNVSLRIRPVLTQDNTYTSCVQVVSKQPPVLLILDRSQTYHFDKIFTEEVDQEAIYNETVKPLVEYVKKGYNCTVFAYGQTGTGKTYTMGTSSQVANDKEVGLIPRALEQFFEQSIEEDNTEVDISVSFIEIYNEKVFDLLQDNNKSPLIVKGVKVQGYRKVNVFNCKQAKDLLRVGNRNRHTAGTKQNSNSSRSHAVFTVYCNIKHRDHETCAKLNLVDLAGCESVRKTGNQGSSFQEGVNINKGLLCIGQVMTALSTNSRFIPYRQSIITIILQDSLNTKNFISLIACINSNMDDCNETIQTLDFAQRVKKMKNNPEVSEAVTQYKKVNPSLPENQTPKISNTPFKRPQTPSVQQTPSLKRVKHVPLNTINDIPDRISDVEVPSISSIYSNHDVTQKNLSPVFKKYINAMESSLMNKLETVIKNTLKRPTRASIVEEHKNADKENTPKISWNKIQNEVSKLVRHEIVQLSAVANRAASSPIDDDFSKIKRILNYDSPVLDEDPQIEHCQSKDNSKVNPTPEFKVPELPVLKLNKRKISPLSSIEFVSRKSLRLSLIRKDNDNDCLSEESDISIEATYIQKNYSQSKRKALKDNTIEINDSNTSQYCRRSSARLARKNRDLDESYANLRDPFENEIDNSDFQWDRRYDSIRSISKTYENQKDSSKKSKQNNKNKALRELDVNINGNMKYSSMEMPSVFHNENKMFTTCNDCEIHNTKYKRRHSVRLAKKVEKDQLCICGDKSVYERQRSTAKDKAIKLSVADTHIGKKLKKVHSRHDSPATARTKFVLNVLNDGNIKQLEQLHSIGPKTAQQILLFRNIKGKFTKISHLSEMPGWSSKKFEKFAEQNFLKKEL